MMIAHYTSKKALAECIGQRLRYEETSMFGPEYRADGEFCVSNRPCITGIKGREFFATVRMSDGKIVKVS